MSRPSLVDVTEAALRQRLAPGRARPGDRLPPEKELADSLGVSRGTLRLALERLESNGEVNRRQGSGTFLARLPDLRRVGRPPPRGGIAPVPLSALATAGDRLTYPHDADVLNEFGSGPASSIAITMAAPRALAG